MARKSFCNPAGFVQGGILSAMLDDTMGPAVFVMTDGKLYTGDHHHDGEFSGAGKAGADHGRGQRHPARQDRCVRRGQADGRGWQRCSRPPRASARLVDTAKAIR